MIRQCKYCDKKYKTNDKRQQFCNRQCYDASREPHPDKYKKCEICDESFYDNLSRRRFCSKKCRLEAGWITPNPSKKAIFTCDWCKKEFTAWTYRKPKFCSRQCVNEFAATQPRPRARKPKIHITLNCVFCGNSYQTTTHQVRFRGSRFCSNECKSGTMSVERRGKNNPNWNGGAVDPSVYGPNWERQKRKTKKRDSHKCQVCNYKSGGEHFLDVHHIVPVKMFNGDWRESNKLKNLISLCRPCHRKVEQRKIPCPTPLSLPK